MLLRDSTARGIGAGDPYPVSKALRSQPYAQVLNETRAQFLKYLDEPISLDMQLVGYMDREWAKFPSFVSRVPLPDL
jgi:hypothetical protein